MTMKSVISENQFENFFEEGFVSPKLTEWLDWSAGGDAQHFVALPMIQRGSVWKPNQIITLWDSLLRGMPIGSLMLSRLKAEGQDRKAVRVRMVGSKTLMDVPAGGGASLIDGQQRTLAMLLGWPNPNADQQQNRTLWVDFADKPTPENLFRIHVTSTAHPYGFTKSDPNARLSLQDRRDARESPRKGQQFPWDSHFPLRLTDLIQTYIAMGQDAQSWKRSVLEQLHNTTPHRGKSWPDFEKNTVKWNASKAVDRFGDCLQDFFKLRIALIAIPDKCFAESEEQVGEDPALAVLFKRVGTGGVELSHADYVYSVIKHHVPDTFELVESLASEKGFAQSLGPTDIVMTAVRLVAADLNLTDFESPNKANFDSLRKNPEFLKSFLAMVERKRLSNAMHALTEGLRFDDKNGITDPGLPLHGFILVSRPVLQILLRWLLMASQQHVADAKHMDELVANSRAELLRFVLYAYQALPDIGRASAWAFGWFKEHQSVDLRKFPGRELVRNWRDRGVSEGKQVAWLLPTKDQVKSLVISVVEDKAKPLRGWERFKNNDDAMHQARAFFHRWWGYGNRYQHAMLLWLQRSYVDRIEKNPDEVRSDDEVPYDYDHICPSNHWSNWTGITSPDSLLRFLAVDKNRGHIQVGNSIGNLRVWYASDNRSDGDKSAIDKLKRKDSGNDAVDTKLLEDSAMHADHVEHWTDCSGKGSAASWTNVRALAFQTAVEHRVYDLYARYFDELNFGEWFPLPDSQAVTTTSA